MWGRSDFNFDQVALGVEHGHAEAFDTADFRFGRKALNLTLWPDSFHRPDATVVGDTVGDPFKDTSSVALNPVIKFTTLFGLLAVELAVSLTKQNHDDPTITRILALVFFLVSVFFVWRSFHRMRIGTLDSAKVSGDNVSGD